MFTLSMNIQSVQRAEGGSKSPAKYPSIQAPPSPPAAAAPPASLSSSLWRFWKWIPPTGARPTPACATDNNYGQLMAHFKEHLAASQSCLYAINELRLFATLEVPEILDYVSEDGVGLLQDEAGRGGRGSSASSSSLASAYSSASSSSGNCGGTSAAATAASSSSSSVRGYYIFKEGIWPLWEDEYNAAGGCWTFRHTVARSAQSGGGGGGQPREMWKLLILTLSDPRMAPFLEAGEICGAGLTVRQTAHRWIYKFSIWNSNADNTIAKLMIGSTLKSLVSLPNGGGSGGNGSRLFYYSHRTNMLKQQQQQQLHFQHPLMGGFKLQRKMAPRNSLNYSSGRGAAAASRKKSVTFLEQF